MTNIFDDTSNVNKMCFKNNSRLRLKDLCAQKWTEEVNKNSTCYNYRAMTVVKKNPRISAKTTKILCNCIIQVQMFKPLLTHCEREALKNTIR